MADAFLSYARVDKDSVSKIHDALTRADTDVWIDWEGIPPTAKWMAEIHAAIEAADYFVFAISPDSATSEICRLEIEHALAHRKRIIPLLVRAGDVSALHPEVAKINWIAFDDPAAFDTAMQTLREALATDLDYVRAHTRLLVKAREWEAHALDDSYLLRGSDLAQAESLIGNAQEPAATPLQTRFVVSAQRAANRRRRRLLASLIGAFVITIGLAVWALVQQRLAEHNEALAVQREQTAQRLRFNSDMKLAFSEWELGRVDQTKRLLAAHTDRHDLFIWRYLHRLTTGDDWVFEAPRPVSVRFAPDGKRLFGGGDDTGLIAWSLSDGSEDRMEAIKGRVDSVDVSPDGRRIVWVDDGVALLLDEQAGDLQTLPFVRVETVRFAPDGRRIALATGKTVTLWDVATAASTGRIELSQRAEARCLAFIPGTDLLAIGADKGRIEVWHTDPPRRAVSLQAPAKRQLFSLAASPDGRYLASAVTSHGSIDLWTVADWQRKQLVDVYHNSPTDGLLSFSPDSRHLASPDGDMVKIWEVGSSRLLKTYRGHTRPIAAVDWSANGERIASAGYDGSVRVWRAFGDQRWDVREIQIEDWADWALIDLAPDRRHLLAGAIEIQVYRLHDMASVATLRHDHPVVDAVYSSDHALLATVTGPYEEEHDWTGAEIVVWGLHDGDVRLRIPPDGLGVVELAFKTGGRVLGVEVERADGTTLLRQWDIASGELIEERLPEAVVSEPAKVAGPSRPWEGRRRLWLSPDGGGAAAAEKTDIVLWPSAAGPEIVLGSHSAVVTDVAHAPDGQHLASISIPVLGTRPPLSELKIWDTRTGSELAGFELNDDLRRVGFSDDGRLLIVLASDGRVYRFRAD